MQKIESEQTVFYKLLQGDCCKVLPTLEENSVDLIVTDPPYFLPIQSYVGTRDNGYSKRTLADVSILKGYFERIFEELDRVIKPTGTYYVFCDAQSYPVFYETIYPYCKYVRLLIWDKVISYNGYTWRHQHELIAWGEKDDSERIKTGDGDIIKCRGVLQSEREHPAEKPVKVLSKLIKKHERAEVVLDPYIGSGSTMMAAQNCGKSCIGIELEPSYCEIVKKRCFGRTFFTRKANYDFSKV